MLGFVGVNTAEICILVGACNDDLCSAGAPAPAAVLPPITVSAAACAGAGVTGLGAGPAAPTLLLAAASAAALAWTWALDGRPRFLFNCGRSSTGGCGKVWVVIGLGRISRPGNGESNGLLGI